MDVMHMERRGTTLYVRLTGEVTMVQVPLPRNNVEEILAMGSFEIVAVDLSQAGFMDSTGVNFLAMLNNRIREMGKAMHVVSPSEAAMRILDLTQMSALLTIVDSDVS
ncbi:MAG: anti-sigma factor antagonist [Desulfovibrio sp.]|nr:MAG: anti-sigma factor antagonist [Desulfovibrio sp.]